MAKLIRDFSSRINTSDREILKEFSMDPKSFLDYDAELCVDLKRLNDKRFKQIEERAKMGMNHINTVTHKQLSRSGVSKREFDLIKRFMKLDGNIFEYKEYVEASPFNYTVDLSKYADKKIPQDLKEVLFRPQKMRRLYSQYWAIASELDVKERDHLDLINRKRWHPKRLNKLQEEYDMMDKFVSILKHVADQDVKYLKKMQKEILEENT